jgi:hypothetical protein
VYSPFKPASIIGYQRGRGTGDHSEPFFFWDSSRRKWRQEKPIPAKSISPLAIFIVCRRSVPHTQCILPEENLFFLFTSVQKNSLQTLQKPIINIKQAPCVLKNHLVYFLPPIVANLPVSLYFSCLPSYFGKSLFP